MLLMLRNEPHPSTGQEMRQGQPNNAWCDVFGPGVMPHHKISHAEDYLQAWDKFSNPDIIR